MRKQLPPIVTLAFLVVATLSTQTTNANNTFNLDDINSALQIEYQAQLVLRTPASYKAPAKKRAAKKKTKRAVPVIPRYMLPARKPAAKKPISNVENLFKAATYGNINIIARLLKEGVNINASNSERETALHMAAANGRYSTVIYLVNHGANIYARTIKNWLPIHHATRFRKANIVNYMIKKGVSPYARTSDGLSTIDMARALKDQRLLSLFGVRK